jgi:serine/threonine protein kinase
MHKISTGNFKLEGPEWQQVSESARDLIRSLLTVDPSKRMSVVDLVKHPWLHKGAQAAHTLLRTPGILSSCGVDVNAECNFLHAAFATFQRQGLSLKDVSSAPLARRRKQKKNSLDNRSSSSDSNNSSSTSSGGGNASSQSPAVPQSPVRTFSNTSGASTGFVPSQGGVGEKRGVSPLASRPEVASSGESTPVVNDTSLAANEEVVDFGAGGSTDDDGGILMKVPRTRSDSQDSDVAVIPSTTSSVDTPIPEVLSPRKRKRSYTDDNDEDEDDDCLIIDMEEFEQPVSRAVSKPPKKRVKVVRNSTDTIVID